MVAVTPCRSDMSSAGLAPGAHLCDGRAQLLLVRDVPRLYFLRFLASIPCGGAPHMLRLLLKLCQSQLVACGQRIEVACGTCAAVS